MTPDQLARALNPKPATVPPALLLLFLIPATLYLVFAWGLVLYKTQVWFLSQVIPVIDPSLHKGMALAAFVWILKGMLSKGPSNSEVLVSAYIGALVAPWAGLGLAWVIHLILV